MSAIRDHSGKDSAGRIIAIGMSAVVAFRLVGMTVLYQAMGWPDAFVVMVAFLSIPFYHLFSGASAASLAGKLLDRFGIGAVAGPAVVGAGVEFVSHQWKNGNADEGVL